MMATTTLLRLALARSSWAMTMMTMTKSCLHVRRRRDRAPLLMTMTKIEDTGPAEQRTADRACADIPPTRKCGRRGVSSSALSTVFKSRF